MKQAVNEHGLAAYDARRDEIYWPKKRPGFVAWASAFDYGNGDIGLAFKETLLEENKAYRPATIEEAQVMGAPVSYSSVFCGTPEQTSYRVYMKSSDSGKTFTETGRCPLVEGSYCNVGFPDGRIIGMEVATSTGTDSDGSGCIEVRESCDGGNTWKVINRLLPGSALYLWRARKLRDGSIVLCACFYGTPWGAGQERATRNTMFPGESYNNKIQTFFLISSDEGRTFSGPHYVLPGTGAHEYDFVELPDGSLLFIGGDVQGTPVCRQIVSHKEGRWINGTLYGIGRGAPEDPANNPQGGFVPESMVILPDGLIVGSRRNKRYSCSNDFGENWYEIDNLPTSLYQPFMLLLPNGQIANFGYLGGDCAFGQADMYIGADIFRVENQMPPAGRLLLKRDFSENGDRYINQYTASFLLGDKPITGEKLTFRFNPVWKDGHLYNVVPQEEAPVVKYAVTDEKGQATVTAEEFDHCGDIHYSYTADVIYRPGAEGRCRACDGPRMVQYGMTPVRRCRYPYDAYFAEGALYLSPLLLQEYPDLIERISPLCGEPEGRLEEKVLPEAVIERFLACGVLVREDGALFWRKSVHAPVPLNRVLSMAEGDWYE